MEQFTINIDSTELKNNHTNEFSTVKELIEELKYWENYSKENNCYDDFLNLKIQTSSRDKMGNIVDSDTEDVIGWCGDRFLLTSKINNFTEPI